MKKPKLLITSIVLSQLAGAVGSIATAPSIPTWYAGLVKPSFSPPNWIFAPVWTTLYTLMGIALYLVWSKGLKKKEVNYAVKVFLINLALNSIWSIVFFGFRAPAAAFAVILALWLIIAYLIKLFWEIDKRASYLLIPYILWVSFALLLNFAIWRLN